MAVLPFLKKEDVFIAFLQKTHLEENDNAKLQRNQVLQHHIILFYCVAILISKELAFRCLDCVKEICNC